LSPKSLRSMFFIDGFNVYHSLARNYRKYLWLDFMELAHKFSFPPYENVKSVRYFTAFADWRPGSAARHRKYVELLEKTGVEVILGRFQEKKRKCCAANGCGQLFTIHEEKLTDVNIAVSIVEACVTNQCDILYLISGDNDLVPALETAQRLCSKIEITVILPINARANQIKQICRRNGYKVSKISERFLSNSQFPDSIQVEGTEYSRPQNWL